MLEHAIIKEHIVMITSTMLKARDMAHSTNSGGSSLLREETPTDEKAINGKQNMVAMMLKTMHNVIFREEGFQLDTSPITPDNPIIIPDHMPPATGISP